MTGDNGFTAASDLYGLLAAYLRHLGVEGATEATLRHKAKENRLFLAWLGEAGHSMRAEDVICDHVVGHLADMKRRGLRPATVKTRHRALRAWWGWMVRMEITGSNPPAKIRSPREPAAAKPFLSEPDFGKLLDLCDPETLPGCRRRAMLLLLATTGIRRRELQMLRTEDLDWERGRVLVRNGKGQKERVIPFLGQAQDAVRLYLGHRRDSDPALWITELGLPLQYHGVGQDISRLYRRAGVRVVDSVHIFRRSFARSAVLQAIPRPYIKAVAGWSMVRIQSLPPPMYARSRPQTVI